MVCEAPEHLALLTCLTSLLATDLPWLTQHAIVLCAFAYAALPPGMLFLAAPSPVA